MSGWPGEQTVRWQSWEKQASYSTPIAVTIHGRRQVLCLMRQGLVSLDPKTGAVNFSFWFRSRANDSVNAMTPVVVDDLIFISGAYYKVGSVLLRVNPDGKGVEEVWRGTTMELHWTTPIYVGGYLYAFSGRNEPDARMRCIEFKTGKLMWDRDDKEPPHKHAHADGVRAGIEHPGGRKNNLGGRRWNARTVQTQPTTAGGDLPFSSAATSSSLLGRAGAGAQKAVPTQRRPFGLPEPRQVTSRVASIMRIRINPYRAGKDIP